MNTVNKFWSVVCDVLVVAVLAAVACLGSLFIFMEVANVAGELVGLAVAVAVLLGSWVKVQQWKRG